MLWVYIEGYFHCSRREGKKRVKRRKVFGEFYLCFGYTLRGEGAFFANFCHLVRWDFNTSSAVFVEDTALDFGPGHTLMLRADVGVLSPCLVILYFRTVEEQIPRLLRFAPQLGDAAGVHILTFGGQDVSENLSYFRFNGNAYSPVDTRSNGAGNLYVAAFLTRVFRLFWSKANAGPTNVEILRNSAVVQTFGMNTFEGNVSLDLPVAAFDTLQIRYSGRTPPGTCLLTLYAQPAFYSILSAGVIHFGGVINLVGNFLRANGNGTSAVNSTANAIGNVSLVGVASRPYAVTWNTAYGRSTTTLQLLRNNVPIYDLDFLDDGASSLRHIQEAFAFKPGDTMQVRFVDGHPPERSVVSIYMTPA